MDRTRLLMALGLSMVVLMSWPLVVRCVLPGPIVEPVELNEPLARQAAENSQPAAAGTTKLTAPATAPVAQQPSSTTQVGQREVEIAFVDGNSQYWRAKISNRGAVATAWTLSRYKEN